MSNPDDKSIFPGEPPPGAIVSNPPFTIDTAAAQSGAVYRPIHFKRNVKIYPIQESELMALTDLEKENTLWSSIGSGAITFIMYGGWDWLQMPKGEHPSAQSIGIVVFAAVVSAYSFIKASALKKTVAERLKHISEECVPLE